jgi:hypothetical protein
MKKIVLLGDSIRKGYDKYVKMAFKDVAEVYYPTENCRFAAYTLRFLPEWKKAFGCGDDVDCVHWNVGLWDLLELGEDGTLSSLAHYSNMIERIDKRIRQLFQQAKVVFATSTAVREHEYTGEWRRHNATIETFNKTALDALKGTDTVINDLYAHTVNAPAECCSDRTHYNTPQGAAYMGGKVLSVICSMLDIAASEVRVEGFELEKYSADLIGF